MPENKPQRIVMDGREVEVVRVREVASKHEFTVTRLRADDLGEAVEVLDKPAVDKRGALLPAKPHRNITRDQSAGSGTASSTGRAPKSQEDSK